jgi:hypothetical protein
MTIPEVHVTHEEAYLVSAAKHSQAMPGLVATGMVHGNVRHATEPLYRENYQHFDTQGVMRVLSDPVSTF